MTKTYEGVFYNTAKDEKLVTIGEFWGYNALYEAETSLYRTADGHYYFYGRGGAGTQFSHRTATGGYVGGDKVIPLDIVDAKEWVLRHSTYNDFTRIFGEDGREYAHRIYIPDVAEYFDARNKD